MTPPPSPDDRTHVLPGGRLRTKSRREKVGGKERKKLTPKHCGALLKGRLTRGETRYCHLPAGHGTDHPGVGTCSAHGGNTTPAKKAAGTETAYAMIMNEERRLPSDMVEIEPHNGLLIAVRSAAGEFMFWQELVQEAAAKGDEHLLDLVVQMRESRMQMARLSKMSLDAGLAERQVQLQERMAELMAAFARELVKQLPLTDDQRRLVPEAIKGALLTLTAGEGYKRTPKPTQALRNFKYKDVVEVDAAA